jgi:hypothetical protein
MPYVQIDFLDSKWHYEEHDLLDKLEKQCNELYRHTIKEYTYYNRLSTKFNVPILVISSMNALCAISLNEFLEQKYVSILNAVLSAGTGVLGSIQLYLKLNEKMTNSLRSSINVKKLAIKISKEIKLKPGDRSTNGHDFMSECYAEFNTILEQGNPIEKKLANFIKNTVDADEETTQSSSPVQRIAQRFIRMSRPSIDNPSVASQLMNLARTPVNRRDGGGGTPESEV